MTITDYTEAYISHVLNDNNPERYEAERPELFSHYYQYWTHRGQPPVATADEVRSRRDLIADRLPRIQEQVQEQSHDLSGLELVLCVGNGTTNGHGLPVGDHVMVWIPVETYTSETLVDVFVTHEIIHALHYQLSPRFFLADNQEKDLVSRLLITEGLATALTSEILDVDEGTALWADYMSTEAISVWVNECGRRESELFAFYAECFDSSEQGWESFCLIDPDNILENRAGYYVGLELIKRIRQRHDLSYREMLSLEYQRFTTLVREELERN